MPPSVGWLECQDKANLEVVQAGSEVIVLTIQTIGNNRLKWYASGNRLLHQFQGDLRFCVKVRIRFTLVKPMRRGIGFNFQRVIEALISPQTGDGYNTIV